MLTLLEDKDKTMRKLALISLISLLRNNAAKLYMVEKCGLPSKPGKVSLTRLKYIQKEIQNQDLQMAIIDLLLK